MRDSIPHGLINNTLIKMASNSRSTAVVQTLFFHSTCTCRYHLHKCRPELYYECNWNGARIIVNLNSLENKGDIQETTSLILVISPFFSIILFASLAFAEMESPSTFYKTRLWPSPNF